MVKGELRNFMIVITREGGKYMVRDDYIVSRTGYEPLDMYNRDMTHCIYSCLDIIQVYESEVYDTFNTIKTMDKIYDRIDYLASKGGI